MKHTPPQQLHIPVLLEDSIRLLAPQAGQRYLDLTAGYGGHASNIADVTGYQQVTLVDRDSNAIAQLQQFADKGARIIKNDFLSAATGLVEAGESFDMILIDLGVSSPQLDNPERGFSIKRDGPLDMRMDDKQQKTAADIVNHSTIRELTRIIETYGEERPRAAARIVEAIVKARPHKTTSQLAQAILQAHHGPHQKVHPATRTFQAIRIALNDELEQIKATLPLLPRLLRSGGRVAVISFHSLEDRIVKQYFADTSSSGYEAEFELLTKKAILGERNDVHNPRARSAVLRAAVKK